MKNVSFLYKNLPSPLTKRITWPQTTVFWLGNTATTSSWSTALLPQWHPPRPAHTSHHRVIHQRGSRALQKPKLITGETAGLGRLVPELLFPWDTRCFPLGENSKHRELGSPSTEQLCAVGVSTTEPVGTPQHCWHSGAKTHQTPWAPQSCALLLLPEESYRTAVKGKQPDIKPLIWFH